MTKSFLYLLATALAHFLYPFAQTKTSSKYVVVPDSIAYQLDEASLKETKNVYAGKNILNLANKKDFSFKNGLYSFQGAVAQQPRRIFIYNKTKLFIFKNVGAIDPKGVIREFSIAVNKIGLTEAQTVKYARLIAIYLTEETKSIYEIDIKR